MGAFFLSVDWGGAAADAAAIARAQSALRGFAPFGFESIRVAGVLLVVARDRDQPGFEQCGDAVVVLDGALSAACRRALQQGLGVARQSDARLALAAFARWGAGAASRLDGRFALVVVDRTRDQVWMLRDRLGQRELHVREAGDRLYVATRASVLLSAANLPMLEDPLSVAAYFALRAPPTGAGYWLGVRTVTAGEGLVWRGRRLRSSKQSFDLPLAPARFSSDAEAVEAWGLILRGACARALAESVQPGLLLSGGIDSSAIAASAVSARPNLVACYWSLSAFPTADESGFSSETAARLGLPTLSIHGEQHAPLARLDCWRVEDESPHSNPYRWLHHHLFEQAAGHGIDTLLSGNFGDHLYPDGPAVRSWLGALGQRPRQLLHRFPTLMGGLRRLSGRYPALPQWLAETWRQPLQSAYIGAGHPLLAVEAELDAELGRRHSSSFGLDLRFPYRDVEVIRFVASLPAHFSVRGDAHKWITREAMRDRLPERVRSRAKAGSLEPFFRKGVLEDSRDAVQQLLRDPGAKWPRYVKPEQLWEAVARPGTESDLLLIWLVLSYELWWRAHAGLGPAVLASAP